MNSFATPKNRCAVVNTPSGDILCKSWFGYWICKPVHLAYALGYRNVLPAKNFGRICKRLGAPSAYHDGNSPHCTLTDVVDLILPNITNELMKSYKSDRRFDSIVGIEPCEFEHNVRIVKEILTQFMAENASYLQKIDEPSNAFVNDWDFAKLTWEDFSALATWMAEEIAGNYIMSKKDYNNQSPDAPIYFRYRVPVVLWHEERTLLALFIKNLFREFWKTGKTSGFDSQKILRKLACGLGMSGYETNQQLSTLCKAITEKFHCFIRLIKVGEY